MTRFITVLVLMIFVAGVGFWAVSARDMRSDGMEKPEHMEEVYVTQSSAWVFQDITCWPTWFGIQSTSEVDASFASNGTLGRNFGLGPRPDVSFESPPGSDVEHLFGASVWIGGIVGEDTLVSVGYDGWYPGREMFPPEGSSRGSVTEIDYVADYSMRAQYSDTFTAGVDPDYFGRPHIPLPVEIALRSHTVNSDEFSEIVMYDMVLTNIGQHAIQDMYIGVYVDADVGWTQSEDYYWADDLTGSFADQGIGYIIDNDGGLYSGEVPLCPKIFAFKFLDASWSVSHANFNWWISNGNPAQDFGPRQRGTAEHPFRDYGTGGIGTPEGDVNKYYIMSFPEWDYDQIYTASIADDDSIWLYPIQGIAADFSNGHDARFLMSIGSFDLPAGESERLLFATFTAESVHVDPMNLDNLPFDPDNYLANLNFNSVLANAAWADSLVDSLLDPLAPVVGLRFEDRTATSITIRWDPWVLNDVISYQTYLNEVPPSDMPYPGLAPPWWRPDSWNPAPGPPGVVNEHTLITVDSHKVYAASVANQTASEDSQPCAPLFLRLQDRAPGPEVSSEFIFTYEGEPVTLAWEEPPGVDIDHHNIYRFDSAIAPWRIYHPFYDEGCMSNRLTPLDTFEFPELGKTYYYYALQPYAQVDGRTVEWSDSDPLDGAMYYVTSVDIFGFESEFSQQVESAIIERRTMDILVIYITHFTGGVHPDTISNYYDSLLQGYNYDLYNQRDSISYCEDYDSLCIDWHDFMRYRLVLVDDDLGEQCHWDEYAMQRFDGLTRYLLTGGKLAYFGTMKELNGLWDMAPPAVYPTPHWFVQRFFAVDSLAYMGLAYCAGETWCHQYTGFQWAESVVGSMPNLAFNPNAPFTSFIERIWPCGQCPPSVASFYVNDSAEVTHIARTCFPSTSLLEGNPIGLRTEAEGTETWLFGFHLWYMQPGPARELIEAIIQPQVKTTIEPDTVYAYWANAIDPQPLSVYLGQFPEGLSAADVDPATLIVNSTVTPSAWTILPSHPDYVGEVLELEIPVAPFVDSYEPVWGTSARQYRVTGQFLIKYDSLTASGTVVMSGHIPGDVTGDGVLDISDLIHLVDYMFRDGAVPRYPPAADVDANCSLDIGDIIYLVDYFFTDGAPPRPGCAAE